LAVIDCFSFFNELELLRIRLHELSDVVDKFVLVEATKTHSGLDKVLHYEIHKEEFVEFQDKIVHVIVEDMPMTKKEIENAITPQDRHWLDTGYQLGDNWVRERFQRNAIMRALQDTNPRDIIIIEDADEMVRPEIISNLDATMVAGSNAVGQTLHSYYLNWECVNMPWWGSKILHREFVTNPSEHRFHTVASQYIHNGGWHLSYLGGISAIQDKIKAFAHQEFNIPEVFDVMEQKLAQQKDGIGRLYEYEVVPIDDSYPKYIQNNLREFEHWMYNEHYKI